MVAMCHIAGNRDQLIALLLQLAERTFNILLIHLQDEYDHSFLLFSYVDIFSPDSYG